MAEPEVRNLRALREVACLDTGMLPGVPSVARKCMRGEMRLKNVPAASLVILLLRADPSLAHHDDIPDPPARSVSDPLPTNLRLDPASVTASGLSSGGFFAHQFHVAFSRTVAGAAILAGGPYGCVENIRNPFSPLARLDRPSAAVVACWSHWSTRRTSTTTLWSTRTSGISTRWTRTGSSATTTWPGTTPRRCCGWALPLTGPNGHRCGWLRPVDPRGGYRQGG
jgi:hypothetical protein